MSDVKAAIGQIIEGLKVLSERMDLIDPQGQKTAQSVSERAPLGNQANDDENNTQPVEWPKPGVNDRSIDEARNEETAKAANNDEVTKPGINEKNNADQIDKSDKKDAGNDETKSRKDKKPGESPKIENENDENQKTESDEPNDEIAGYLKQIDELLSKLSKRMEGYTRRRFDKEAK